MDELLRGLDGPDAVHAITPLAPRTRARLLAYADLLQKWQPVKNLVAPSTLPEMWRRHFADAAQAYAAAPDALSWLDLGSGGGFPGLVTAILLEDRPGARVTLIESNGRKAAFLSTVIRELKLPARVLPIRIESAAERMAMIGDVEAVSARALTRLALLLAYAEPWLTTGSRGVFHKGREFAKEVAEARSLWLFDLEEQPSRTEPDGRIAVLRTLKRRSV